jgi:hypothetical protein
MHSEHFCAMSDPHGGEHEDVFILRSVEDVY